ncbi:MAG: tRNA (adenosine(37)-N6)-threonylcarbamoyltransferase complex dimerization subunit type 1 TsaB [Planctomycetaceae bacterium]|jgi:tRNA threonylcarbamoyladenosine biosynthesis protein TsaB|nr:tRNA (adenosine(37)-N6)-threonylcarbamoyltransferase complex dimerization subunit type 1 TsaB [Planctomycetaceae bacterium]
MSSGSDKMANILSIETVDKSGSVALYSGGVLLERILPLSQRSAQSLVPAMDGLLGEFKLLPKDIDKVVVIVGPGSFTGLRVGIITARMFSYVVGAEIIGLTSFETVAYRIFLSGLFGLYSIGVDAQRGEVVVQDWRVDVGGCFQLSETLMTSVGGWWDHLLGSGQNFVAAGPALWRYGEKRPASVKIVDENLFDPRAGAAAKLAEKRKQTSDVWTIKPIYSRPSAADEKLNAKKE